MAQTSSVCSAHLDAHQDELLPGFLTSLCFSTLAPCIPVPTQKPARSSGNTVGFHHSLPRLMACNSCLVLSKPQVLDAGLQRAPTTLLYPPSVPPTCRVLALAVPPPGMLGSSLSPPQQGPPCPVTPKLGPFLLSAPFTPFVSFTALPTI